MIIFEVRALLLFDRYTGMPEEERRRRLAELEREDPHLHGALAALLKADASMDTRLDRWSLDVLAPLLSDYEAPPAPDKRIGQEVGNWRIMDTIARGGMGTVYQVERIDGQYQQIAALKYVRADISSPRLVSALLNERDVLAQLNHPDIVPLLDGGIDDEGYPWFVMQRVDGEPITSWCDHQQLAIRKRVELFIDACDAVAYAHARGTLHQDLKPSNMLVTPEGRPRLLDFGLSNSLVDANVGDYKQLAMTAGYTPPELKKGESPGFTTDIYALGVVLYQLLCARLPVKPAAIRHVPMPPSRLAEGITDNEASARGASGQHELACQLKGELDAIVLRCVATDPEARYPDVESLQADLRAWLATRPVAAHGQGLRYRFGCFVRRNRDFSILAAAAVIVAVVVLALWAWQTQRARGEAVVAHRVNQLLESTLGMATLSGLGDMPMQATELLDHAERTLREQAREGEAGSPEVLARGLSLLARSRALTGHYPRAEALAREALEHSGQDALQTAFNLATLARIQNLQARHAEAERTARQGLAALSLRLTDPYRLAWVRLQDQLAIAQSGQGQSKLAFKTLARAMAEARELSPSIGDPVLAQLLIQRGTWYRWRMRLAESEADLLQAIELAGQIDPVTADDARESLIRTVRASRKSGREARALAMAKKLLDSRQRTLGSQHIQTGQAWTELAFMQGINSDYDSARASLQHAHDLVEPPLGADHPAAARIYIGRAFVEIHAGRVDEAIALTEKARVIYETHNGPAHEFTLHARSLLANLYWSRASMTGDEEARKKALLLLETALQDAERAHGTVDSIHRVAYADLLRGAGKKQEARRQLVRAREDTLWQYGADSQEMLGLQLSEASLMAGDDVDPEATEVALDRLIADAARFDTLYAIAILHTAWLVKGSWLQGRHRLDEAATAFRNAREAAERAGHQGWVTTAERRLAALEQAVIALAEAEPRR
ncbi:protein kinase domain-containing protein [Luteimonas salinilitoris]|uniref:Protein kinase n=1 Tax=Luteimonas salinilitoris TaxID=3237697 RepID=A0ABV4HTQ1_9GAMM